MTDAPKTWQQRRDEWIFGVGPAVDSCKLCLMDGYERGRIDAMKEAQVLVEALNWYAQGRPFRDDLGNETELAISTLITWHGSQK